MLGIGCDPRMRRGREKKKKKDDRRPIENLPTDTSEIEKLEDAVFGLQFIFLQLLSVLDALQSNSLCRLLGV